MSRRGPYDSGPPLFGRTFGFAPMGIFKIFKERVVPCPADSIFARDWRIAGAPVLCDPFPLSRGLDGRRDSSLLVYCGLSVLNVLNRFIWIWAKRLSRL